MNLEQFTEKALRTESVPETVEINATLFNELRSSLLGIVSCLDMMKKNVFYGKEIDVDTMVQNLAGVMNTVNGTLMRIETNSNSAKITQKVKINAREFHGALGLTTEAAEVLELVNLHRENMETVDCADELGDAFWYIAVFADALGLDIKEQVLPAVINKLQKRFPDKFDSSRAISPDKETEKKETAKSISSTREEELEEMTVEELRDLATELDIDGRSALTRKAQLIEAIIETENNEAKTV